MIKVDRKMTLEKAKKVIELKRYYHQEVIRKAMDVIRKNEKGRS